MVYKYQIINKLMKILGVSENIADTIYQYYLTYERRKELMKPMRICYLKSHINILYKHRKLQNKGELSINPYQLEGIDFRGDPDYLRLKDYKYGVKKDYSPSKNILQIQNTYNIDYDKREDYCLSCMGEIYEGENKYYCENPKCFFGEQQCSGLCEDCIEYDEHTYVSDALNYNPEDLRVSHCGQSKCEEYLEDKLERIEDGLVCVECDFVLSPDDFGEYPFDNDEGHIYRKRCDDCYENLFNECLRYWDILKSNVLGIIDDYDEPPDFFTPIYKKEDLWEGYEPPTDED